MTLFEHRDRITKEIIKPAFKEKGFRVSGTTFTKTEQDFVKIFNIQSSGMNLENYVAFYLNLGILFPVFFEIRGYEKPNKPKEYDCQFRIRTDSLTGRNQIYEIKLDTDIEALEKLIKDDLNEYVIPFFDRYLELDDCLNLTKDCRPYIGMTLIKNGELLKGNKMIDEYIPTTTTSWGQELDEYRKKLIKK